MTCFGITKRRGAVSAGGLQMTTPKWVKLGACDAPLGAAAPIIVASTLSGRVTECAAQDKAERLFHEAMTTAMEPGCLAMAYRDTQRQVKLEMIRVASCSQKRDNLMEAGWVTTPGAAGSNPDIARTCLAGINPDTPVTSEVEKC